MNSGVRIIKRNRTDISHLHHDQKTGQTSEREIASTVKNWIAELAQRRRTDETTARTRFLAAIHS